MNRSRLTKFVTFLYVLCGLVLLAALTWKVFFPGEKPGIPPHKIDEVFGAHNRGVALMDHYKYPDAVVAFGEVTQLAPDWPVGHLNLGIALLNEQKDQERTIEVFKKASMLDPQNPRPLYCLAMLYIHIGRDELALELLEKVHQFDPEDLDTQYWLGQVLFRNQKFDEARKYYDSVLEKNPAYVAVHRNLGICLRMGDDQNAAAERLRSFQELKNAGMGTEIIRTIEYPHMGRYAEIVRLGAEIAPKSASSEIIPKFVDATSQSGIDFEHAGNGKPLDGSVPGSPIAQWLGGGGACGDFDGDGDLDIFLTNVDPPDHGNRFFVNDGTGRFTDATATSGLTGTSPAIGAAIGDYDNDGNLDIYVTNEGPNQLFRNLGKGKFADVTSKSGTAGGENASAGAAFIDIDSDGDLDLFVSHFIDQPSTDRPSFQFFINRRDGTFKPDSGRFRSSDPFALCLGAAFGDVDNDFDFDALLLSRSSSPRLFRNERLDGLKPSKESALAELPTSAWSVALADVDGDEAIDAAVFSGNAAPVLLLKNHPPGYFRPGFQKLKASATNGSFFDADNDGDEDLFLVDAIRGKTHSPALFLNDGSGQWTDATRDAGLEAFSMTAPRGALYADFDADGDTDVLIINNGGRAIYLRNDTPPKNHFIHLNLIGTRETGKTRSATFPIGTKVFAQAGPHHQKKEFVPATGFLSQNSPQLTFGLGPRTKLDYLRLIWPDGVLQSEMEIAAGQTFPIKETSRKASSCPVLFAWDGTRFEFVTDMLGGGGLGFFLAQGTYARPQPVERIRLEAKQLQPMNGRYELRIIEPLEETVYLDLLRLEVIDHPADCSIYPDERLETGHPSRTDRIYCVREPILPIAARTGRTDDVLEAILAIDRRTVDDFEVDKRFLGFSESHFLELEFGRKLESLPRDRPVILYLYGWVEYPYSQTNFAAFQAGLQLQPPSLQIQDSSGEWRTVLPEVGYPAGMPKMMTLDISKWARESDGRFRLITNMEIYWDAAFIAPDDPMQKRVSRPPVDYASLRPCGFPREYSPDGRLPLLFDYQLMDPNPGFKLMSGDYTRYGNVGKLLEEVDDQFVIMGRGDEIAISFDATRLPPLPAGWTRSFILRSDGFCKDMDLYTAEGQTVEPLPFHGMSNYPYPKSERYPGDPSHTRYRQTWNSRKVH